MKYAVLDYGGTLDCLTDPLGYIRTLQSRGWVVVLHTGSPDSAIASEVLHAVDQIIRKPNNIDLDDATEVVVVDDMPMIGAAVLLQARRLPGDWRFLLARDMEDLLER